MNNTIKINIVEVSEDIQQVLVAELSAIGFYAFEEKDNELDAFINEDDYNENLLNEIFLKYNFNFNISIIPPQNWNALWESSFQPILIDDFCHVRAHFHAPVAGVQHDIIITPKMSFGTGHHPTTHMMLTQMREIEVENKSVADFGTGTGILSILAEKMGARSVWAIDNDDWSINNATENVEKNNCHKIELEKLERFGNEKKFDLILANINRNVILDNVTALFNGMEAGGHLLLSGLLKDDEATILSAFNRYNIKVIKTLQNGYWISILIKSDVNL